MFRILCIFALWIGWFGHHPIRGTSIAPSTFLMIDVTKKIDNMTKKKPLAQLLLEFNETHGNKYCYSKVNDENYVNNRTKIPVICKEHGVFFITPYHHIKGVGCSKCGGKAVGDKLRKSQEDFILQAKKVHGNKYDYGKVKYINSNAKVCITCPIHGDFLQYPSHHLRGRGCPECGGTAKKETEQFIEQSNLIHNGKYSYKKTVYTDGRTKVIITCPIHGDFLQTPYHHLRGHGCPYCGHNHRYSTEEFVEMANKVHSYKYQYNKTTYINSHSKVIITCSLHGDFEQKPYLHLNGNGCPTCKSTLGENKIAFFLKQKKIKFIAQYKLHNEYLFCKNKHLYVDFYLPTKNVIIEFNGAQHYIPTKFFSDKRNFKEQQERDNAVRYYCKKHNIKLIEIPYTDFDNIEDLLNRELKI